MKYRVIDVLNGSKSVGTFEFNDEQEIVLADVLDVVKSILFQTKLLVLSGGKDGDALVSVAGFVFSGTSRFIAAIRENLLPLGFIVEEM